MTSSIHHPGAARGRTAFTLLEVLLAVTILGLAMTAVYGTWNVALRAWKRGTDISDTFQRQRIVMDTLADLARSAVFFISNPLLYEVIGDHDAATGSTVSFVTASDTALPPSEILAAGMRRVTISMEHDEKGTPYLSISNQPALESDQAEYESRPHVLSNDVAAFLVRYRDPRDGTWHELWRETQIIPSAMEFTVVFVQKDPRLPPVVVTRAVEIPAAQFAMLSAGQALSQQNTTNEVRRRDVNLSELLNGARREADQ